MERTSNGVRLHAADGVVRAETVVICAGAATPLLAGRDARVPIVGGRGYAFEVPRPRPVDEPGPLVYLHEQRIAVTPWTDAIRFAGTLELGYVDGPPKGRRVAGISRGARRAFPDLEWQRAKPVRSGARPCTPDGLPVVGRLDRDGRVIVAAGHAMLGLTLAPITGALVGGLLEGGSSPEPTLRALSHRRFE
ncbi:MAG: FAD-binding oxidoreductase, partial [Actinobacteria bacterium]|nr:FAD-binding oxidoreductase [Actinomycetota bacterium]